MSRPIALSLIIVIIVGLSLAAVAAVGVTAVPTQAVTPQIHKSGEDGYFRIQVPLPRSTPAGPVGLGVMVESGDCWLVAAQSYSAASGSHREDDEDDESSPVPSTNNARMATVTGRYSHPGPVRLAISVRASGEAFRPVLKLTFQLPDAPRDDPEV